MVDDFAAADAKHVRINDPLGKEVLEKIELGAVLGDLRSKSRRTILSCFGIKVEAFVPWHPFHHQVLKQSPKKDFEGRTIKVHAPEDLIVFKKIFDRSKDIEDIKSLLAANVGKLDLDRIRSNARQLIDEPGLAELEELIQGFYR